MASNNSTKTKTIVRFAQDTKMHDGLSPLSYIVETSVVALFEGNVTNQKDFIALLLKLIEQRQLDVEHTLTRVSASLQHLVERCQNSRHEHRGAPILACGGGQGLYIPKSAIVYIQRMILWLDCVDLADYFNVEVSV